MRFGAVFGYCTSNGAVRCCDISYGAVRFGFEIWKILRCGSVRFSDIVHPTVRFGAVIYPTVRFGSALKYGKSYRAVRCGFQE